MSLSINLKEFEKSVENELYQKIGILLASVNQALIITQIEQENKLTFPTEFNAIWYNSLANNFFYGAIAIFGISAVLQVIFYFIMARQEKLYFWAEFGLMLIQILLITWNAYITSQIINLYG
jgi:hypothetical protein